jgi:hypothetical protein
VENIKMEEEQKRKFEDLTEDENAFKKRKTNENLPEDYYNKIMIQRMKLKFNVLKKEKRPKLIKLKQSAVDDKLIEIENFLNRKFEFLKAGEIFSFQDSSFLNILVVGECENENERIHIKFQVNKVGVDKKMEFIGAVDSKTPEDVPLWF